MIKSVIIFSCKVNVRVQASGRYLKPKKSMVYGRDSMPELTITSPYVHSRVDSNTITMGNPLPESTLSPVRDFGFGLWKRTGSFSGQLLPVPEFIDPVFTKTSPKRSFSVIQNERFGLVFTKTGSINSGWSSPLHIVRKADGS